MPNARHEDMCRVISRATGAQTVGWVNFIRDAIRGVTRLRQDDVGVSFDEYWEDMLGGSRLSRIRPDAFTVVFECSDEGPTFPVLHCWEVSDSTKREAQRYIPFWTLFDEVFGDFVVHVVCAKTGVEMAYRCVDIMALGCMLENPELRWAL